MKKIYFILLTIILASCQKESIETDNEYYLIGHGGMGYTSQYPINSLESIINALEIGADGIEIDAQLTHDGVLVAYHNENLKENTNKSGIVNDHTWNYLNNTYYTDVPYTEYKVQRVDEIVQVIQQYPSKKIFIDCKMFANTLDSSFYNSFINAINELMYSSDYANYDNIIFESPDVNFLQQLYNSNPQLHLYYYANSMKDVLQFPNIEMLKGIMFRQEYFSKEEIDLLKQRGLATAAWSITNPDQLKTAVNKGIDYLQVDRLRKLLQYK